jgi:hypothetical protein
LPTSSPSGHWLRYITHSGWGWFFCSAACSTIFHYGFGNLWDDDQGRDTRFMLREHFVCSGIISILDLVTLSHMT